MVIDKGARKEFLSFVDKQIVKKQEEYLSENNAYFVKLYIRNAQTGRLN